jgi:hypothetical protein
MMRTIRRLAALLAVVAMAGALAGPATSAGADTPADFVATGAGRALNLGILGEKTTLGVANATVKSAMSSASGAAGQLLNLATTTAANVTHDNTSLLDPLNGLLKCGPITLPSVASLLSVSTACSQSKAAILKSLPQAHSEGSVANIDLTVNGLLKSLNVGVPLGQTLSGLLTPITNLLNQGGGNTQLAPTSTITDLLNALTSTKTLSIVLGKSVSDLATEGSTVTSKVSAVGGQIDLLPIPVLNNTPLASIIIGSASATASQDKTNGSGTATFDPSVVTIKLASILGLPATTIPVRPGQTITILQGTPLESTVIVGDGRSENVKGSSKAMADGVSLNLLKGLALGSSTGASAAAGPTGGIVLELAHAEAAVVSSPAVITPAPQKAVERQLPFTGPPRWMMFLGIAALGVGFAARRLLTATA